MVELDFLVHGLKSKGKIIHKKVNMTTLSMLIF